MDELLQVFVETYFTEELQEEIKMSFDLFDFFEYQQAYTGMIDIAMNQSNQDSSMSQDLFLRELNAKLDYCLEQHMLKTTDECSLSDKNQILRALAHIQNLEDYTSIIRTLESFEPDEVQLAEILSDLTTFDVTDVMLKISEVNPLMLQQLKKFIYSKEQEETPDQAKLPLRDNMRLFIKLFGDQSAGAQLFAYNILLGEKFTTYLSYVEDNLVGTSDENTALNILSLIYLTTEGYNSPLLIYRKFSYRLLQDLNRVSRVEVHLLNAIARFSEFKKIEEEKAKLNKSQEKPT